jgi:hypothetical protein
MKTNTSQKNSVCLPGGPTERSFSKARSIAARYGLCPKTIFRLADRGLIHRFKLGERVVLFSDLEVAALFESARIPTATPVSQFQGVARAQVPNGTEGGAEK